MNNAAIIGGVCGDRTHDQRIKRPNRATGRAAGTAPFVSKTIFTKTAEKGPVPSFELEGHAAALAAAITGFIWPADRCLYCGSRSPHFQQDHFPIPAALGGVETVRACLHCHTMKDRVSAAIAEDAVTAMDPDAETTMFAAAEIAFIWGCASLLPWATWALLDNLRDYQPPVRILIARRLRAQIGGMP
jgi:hypothetical protein